MTLNGERKAMLKVEPGLRKHRYPQYAVMPERAVSWRAGWAGWAGAIHIYSQAVYSDIKKMKDQATEYMTSVAIMSSQPQVSTANNTSSSQ